MSCANDTMPPTPPSWRQVNGDALAIEWWLADEDWQEACDRIANHRAGAAGDAARHIGDLLVGEVQLAYRGERLFPPRVLRERAGRRRATVAMWGAAAQELLGPDDEEREGKRLSLVALAVQLAVVLDQEGFAAAPIGTQAILREDDDWFAIALARVEGRVAIATELPGGSVLHVPLADFVTGVRTFLWGFTREVSVLAPALLAWDALAPLRRYRAIPATAVAMPVRGQLT